MAHPREERQLLRPNEEELPESEVDTELQTESDEDEEAELVPFYFDLCLPLEYGCDDMEARWHIGIEPNSTAGDVTERIANLLNINSDEAFITQLPLEEREDGSLEAAFFGEGTEVDNNTILNPAFYQPARDDWIQVYNIHFHNPQINEQFSDALYQVEEEAGYRTHDEEQLRRIRTAMEELELDSEPDLEEVAPSEAGIFSGLDQSNRDNPSTPGTGPTG